MKSKKQKRLISIIIPCFNEQDNVREAYRTVNLMLRRFRRTYHFEYIFIDNGSVDATRKEIAKIAAIHREVRGVFLSRNFGPESSSQAGFDFARGDAVIWFACDMQEPAEILPKFIRKWEDGFDSVIGVYAKLEDPLVMTILRRAFYAVMKYISNVEIPVNSSGFGLYSRRVVAAMSSLPEKYRFGRGIRSWVGFSTVYITYRRRARTKGKSSYSIAGYFRHAERSVFGFSYLPLDLLVYSGFSLTILSFLFIIGYIGANIFYRQPIRGGVAILVAIVFFGGVNLLALSVIGKYIQVIVEETKARPTYIVDKVI